MEVESGRTTKAPDGGGEAKSATTVCQVGSTGGGTAVVGESPRGMVGVVEADESVLKIRPAGWPLATGWVVRPASTIGEAERCPGNDSGEEPPTVRGSR